MLCGVAQAPGRASVGGVDNIGHTDVVQGATSIRRADIVYGG